MLIVLIATVVALPLAVALGVASGLGALPAVCPICVGFFAALAAHVRYDTEVCASRPRPARVKRVKGGTMRMGRRGAILLAGLLIVMQVTAGDVLADGQENSALRLLLNKGIITQQEYDEAVAEEQHATVEEEQREKQATEITKHGLQIHLGGFAEIDFIGDIREAFRKSSAIVRSYEAIRWAEQTASFSPVCGTAGSPSTCEPRNGRASRADFMDRWIFWGTNRRLAPQERPSCRSRPARMHASFRCISWWKVPWSM